MCHIRSQIILLEEKLVRIAAGVSKPAQRRKYRQLAKTWLRVKKNYLLAKENGEKNAIGDFLSAMGHNITCSTMNGRDDDKEETRGTDLIDGEEDHDVYPWVVMNKNLFIVRMYIVIDNKVPKKYSHGVNINAQVAVWDSIWNIIQNSAMDVIHTHITDIIA